MLLVTNQVPFDQSRPVRETIRATGRTIVTGANAICNGIALCDDVIVLARETIRESLIEARVDAMTAELNGLDQIAELEAKLKAKREALAKS
jgi:hypothetical protein